MSSLAGGHSDQFLGNERKDNWWVGPVLTLVGLGGFMVYSTWAAFQGTHFFAVSYLSPFYSPVLFYPEGASAAVEGHAWLGAWPTWLPWPAFLPKSPAFFILAFPGSFRLTCYYYRKAYYRSFAASPSGCAVRARPEKPYNGETRLLLFQNLHRYALYCALVFIGILYYDAFCAFFHEGKFGVGVGSIVLLINATLLAGYTFGCHSLRHLIGGGCNTPCDLRRTLHQKVSCLNRKHMLFAWISLFWVGFSDFYVRMVSMGYITDFNTWPGI